MHSPKVGNNISHIIERGGSIIVRSNHIKTPASPTIISIKIASPVYIGQGKDYINMPIVRKTTAEVIKECMEDYIDKNPNNAKLILEKALDAQRVRETVRKAKETARKTKGMGNGPKPEKLVKCVSKVPEDCCIWLVEGRTE